MLIIYTFNAAHEIYMYYITLMVWINDIMKKKKKKKKKKF